MADENDTTLREQVGRLQSQQAIDPTANVLEHVRLHSLRQDDLRKSEAEYLRREMALRAEHARQLASAEKERLDAIRAIDAQAIQLASNQVASAAATLDARINTLADSNRQQLASTATLLQESIRSLERSQNEYRGQQIQQTESRQQNQWALGAGISVLGLGIAVAGVVIAITQ